MAESWSQARRLESWPPPSLSRALADAGSVAASPTFVARQPIYDGRMEVYGYELLFRAALAELPQVVAEHCGGFREGLLDQRLGGRQRRKHADGLGTLAWKDESEAHK